MCSKGCDDTIIIMLIGLFRDAIGHRYDRWSASCHGVAGRVVFHITIDRNSVGDWQLRKLTLIHTTNGFIIQNPAHSNFTYKSSDQNRQLISTQVLHSVGNAVSSQPTTFSLSDERRSSVSMNMAKSSAMQMVSFYACKMSCHEMIFHNIMLVMYLL